MSPEKVRQFCYLENHFSFIDSLCLCVFTLAPVRTYKMQHLVDLVNAITGWESSLWEIMKLGEKRINMFRAFNAREGCTRAEEKLPLRMFTPLANGVLKGVSVSESEMEEMKDLYYRMRNWTEEGVPTKAKLVELELEWISDGLTKDGIYLTDGVGNTEAIK
jgi:aldehyde:ferredoxin oxidoreductase